MPVLIMIGIAAGTFAAIFYANLASHDLTLFSMGVVIGWIVSMFRFRYLANDWPKRDEPPLEHIRESDPAADAVEIRGIRIIGG